MTRIKLFAITALIAVTVAFVGCSDDDDTPAAPTESTLFEFSFSGMAELDSAYYQAWALIDNAAYSLGKFNVNTSGQMVDTTGTLITGNAFSINLSASIFTGIGITIQHDDDDTGKPSETHFLGGDVTSGSATLTVENENGVNEGFGSVSGRFILATPTNGADNDETSGIWFIDNSTSFSSIGLTLPDFTFGWHYEGWIRVDGKYVSTGTFTTMDDPDSSAAYSATTLPGPDFPGEDFLINAPAGISFPLDLSGKYTMITLEPNPDPAVSLPSPFVLLEANIASDATNNLTYNMTNTAPASLPSGTVTLTVE
jgi:hypothetical protein